VGNSPCRPTMAGFGWGVAECQWKGKPAIVGRHGLLPTQVTPGDNGFLVEGAPDAAEAIVRLVRDPELAAELGRHGRERIRRDHLLPGLALRYLQLLRGLQSGRPAVHRESSPSTPVVAQLVP